jgi:murein DD-endopeptidase MepM/ murein hydrolase activator NlpD
MFVYMFVCVRSKLAKTQYPIDGKKGKAWKITSPFGWRIHPIEKTKKHHNGDDIWGSNPKLYIEAWHDGTVVYAGPSKLKNADGSLGGIGYYVDIRSKIDGKWYVTRSGHMEEGSLKVKTGQKVEAGTILGIMGNTGASAGRHLHFEIVEGKTHRWDLNGKGFVSPIAFVEAVMAFEKLKASAQTITADEGVVNDTPPSFDATTLKAKAKPKGKLVNPVPGFGSAPKKKKG